MKGLLGGSRVVTNGVISRVIVIITHIRGLVTPFKTTHEPPSTEQVKERSLKIRNAESLKV